VSPTFDAYGCADLQTFQRRLKALETTTAQDSPLLAEDQLRVLQRSREQKDRRG